MRHVPDRAGEAAPGSASLPDAADGAARAGSGRAPAGRSGVRKEGALRDRIEAGPDAAPNAEPVARAADRRTGPAPAAARELAGRLGGVLALQRAAGNRAVAELVGGAARRAPRRPPIPIQRYAVNAAADADCPTVIAAVDASTPYAPSWAKTRVAFPHSESFVATEADGTWTVTLRNPRVRVTKSVDMPVYRPTDPAMQTAWDAMSGTLRAHEAQHEAIGDSWRTTLATRMTAWSSATSASNQAGAIRQGQADFAADWPRWVDEHQGEQDMLDSPPFVVTLNCPAPPETEGEGGGEGGAEGPAEAPEPAGPAEPGGSTD